MRAILRFYRGGESIYCSWAGEQSGSLASAIVFSS